MPLYAGRQLTTLDASRNIFIPVNKVIDAIYNFFHYFLSLTKSNIHGRLVRCNVSIDLRRC